MMKVVELKKSFGDSSRKIEVLKNISFEIQKGETLALTGKSGCGKSTLLSLLSGLDTPDSGEIIIEGKKLSALSQRELHTFRSHSMGIVFQQFHLVSTLTALENILLPLEILGHKDAHKIALGLLEEIGLNGRGHHLPHELSGGECQRVAIARALAIKPQIIFADEPSGNLDEETGNAVMNLLFNLVKEKGTTLVLVTHDRDLAERCHRKIRLEFGEMKCY